MNKKKNLFCLKSKSRKSCCLFMKMPEMIKMPMITEVVAGMTIVLSAILADANSLRRHLWSIARFARKFSCRSEKCSMWKKFEKKPSCKRWKTQTINRHITRRRHLPRRLLQLLRNQWAVCPRQPSGKRRVKCLEQLCERIVPLMMIPRAKLHKLWSKPQWNNMMIA